MAAEPRKLWVTRLKESTSMDLIRDTFSTNASKVLKVTLVSGGAACLVFATEDAAKTAQTDVKKVDGRQIHVEVYKESLFTAALPKQAAKIKVPLSDCRILLDQDRNPLISLSHRLGVTWTEDSVEGLHLYCNPSKANMVLGEINNIKRKASKLVADKPSIKPSSPADTSSTRFGMSLAQTAMPTGGERVLVEQRIGMTPDTDSYVITTPGDAPTTPPPPPPPPGDDILNLSQGMVTKLRTVDKDSVNDITNKYPHQTIGNMEIKIKDELLQYLSKHKAAELKRIEDKSGVVIGKHPGKVVIGAKPGSTGRNEGITLAYTDFLQLYNDTQANVKFVNLDMRPLKMDEFTLNEALEKVKSSCPNVMIYNKFKDDGTVTLVGPQDELKKGFLHLPSTGKVTTASPQQSATLADMKKDIKGKDGYSYFGDLSKMNAQKVYTYRDERSGILLTVKNAPIGEEPVDGVVQYCDTKGKVLALATGSGRAKIGEQSLGAVHVHITNQTVKNAQVVYACVSDGSLSKHNMETGLKNAFSSCNQNKHKSIGLPPLSTGKSTSDLADFMDAFVSAFRTLSTTEGANSSIRDIRLISKDPLAIEILSDRFDKEYSRVSGPLSQSPGGGSPAGSGRGKPSWGNKLKHLASPEFK